MRRYVYSVLALSLALGVVGVAPVSAQEPIDAQWAEQFVGSWNVSLETPDGDLPLVVLVSHEGGAVQVQVGSGDESGDVIEDVRRRGDDLVVSYDLFYQGMPISAVVTIRRAGEALQTNWSFMDGMYVTSAEATRR